jgi:hypothetical protein
MCVRECASTVLLAAAIGSCQNHRPKQTEHPPDQISAVREGSAQLRLVPKTSIPGCLTVTSRRLSTLSNLLVADVALTTSRNIADCGCLSSAVLYRSVEKYEDFEIELATGFLPTPSETGVTIESKIVLTTDALNAPEGPIIVHFRCRPPS